MRTITAGDLRALDCAPPLDTPEYSARFTFANITVELRAASALVEAMRLKYLYHCTSATPAFTYSVSPSDDGYAFWCDHDRAWEWRGGSLPLDALAFLTDAALMSAVIHADGELSSMHAAAVALSRKGAVIAGDSTAGKTTTLLACARAGMQILSDERGLLRGPLLHPFVRTCCVREGSASLLLADDGSDRLAQALHRGGPLDLEVCFGANGIAQPSTLRAVFIIDGRGSTARIDTLQPAAALRGVSRWFDAQGNAMDRLCRALSVIRTATCFRLTLGTPAQTASAIRTALESLT
jgi:hypothetical protein